LPEVVEAQGPKLGLVAGDLEAAPERGGVEVAAVAADELRGTSRSTSAQARRRRDRGDVIVWFPVG
jgi:hypothetical protein